jgi:hypothetical protein
MSEHLTNKKYPYYKGMLLKKHQSCFFLYMLIYKLYKL